MHIEEISIDGFLSFENFTIKLNQDKNIIVGTNGVGKTNFLKIINLALNNSSELTKYTNTLDNRNNSIKIKVILDNNSILKPLFIFNYISNCTKNINIPINNPSPNFVNKLKELINKEISNYSEKLRNFKEIVIKIELKNNNVFKYYFINDKEINICNNTSNETYKFTKSIEDLIKNDNNHNQTNNNIGSCIYSNFILNILNNEKIFDEYDGISIIKLLNMEFDYQKISKYTDITNNMNFSINKLFDNFFDMKIKKLLDKNNYYGITKILEMVDINTEYENGNVLSKSIPHIYTSLHAKMKENNNSYRIRDRLFIIKNTNIKLFDKIRTEFKNVTSNEFDIVLSHTTFPFDYNYIILINEKQYICSSGESELIDFLTLYYDNNADIILIDEPCTHLSSQNKDNFRKKFLESTENNKQLILITHDVELISEETCSNLLYFRLNDKNCTEYVSINNKKIKEYKLIFENPKILFASNCLLVEGWHDYRFFKQFLKVTNITNYLIIITEGCGSKLWEICKLLKIKFKMIYDKDKITGNPTNNIIKYRLVNLLSKITDKQLCSNNILHITNNNINDINEIDDTYLIFQKIIIKLLYLYCDKQINIEFKDKNNFKKINKEINCNTYFEKLANILFEKKITIDDFKNEFIKLCIEYINDYPNNDNDTETYLTNIIDKIWKSNKPIENLIDELNKTQHIVYLLRGDIENFGCIIFNDNNFNKNNWETKSNSMIYDEIKKKYNNCNKIFENNDLNNIYLFLTNKLNI